MLARPLFRERHRPDMSEEEATELLHEGLRVPKSSFCASQHPWPCADADIQRDSL